MINYNTTKIYELLDIQTGDRVILSSVLRFKSFVLYALRKKLNNYLKGMNTTKMKHFKSTADILLKNNYKLNLIEQCLECKTKYDVQQKIAEVKRTFANVNDKEAILPDVLIPTKEEHLLKNDIVMETKHIYIDIFNNREYKGRYYKIIERKNKVAVCVAVEIEEKNGIYYYRIVDNTKYFLFFNLIKKVDYLVREWNENVFLTPEQIIQNDELEQRRRRIKLIEKEEDERRNRSIK